MQLQNKVFVVHLRSDWAVTESRTCTTFQKPSGRFRSLPGGETLLAMELRMDSAGNA